MSQDQAGTPGADTAPGGADSPRRAYSQAQPPAPLALRRFTEADMPLLHRIYGHTRDAEMAMVDWDAAQKRAFVDMQFTAQHRFYQEHYGAANFDVVLRDGEPVGRLYVDRTPAEIHIIDIALLPEYQNAGIGTTLLRWIQAEAAATGRRVTIHVEQFNPALRLYARLGFTPIELQGVYYLMHWHPPTPPADQAKIAS
jgi:ribosomal protein S18 acetylase RimI-like enzyme